MRRDKAHIQRMALDLIEAVEKKTVETLKKKSSQVAKIVIATVIQTSPYGDTARVRLANSPSNGAEDLLGVNIKTPEKISNNSQCLLVIVGEELKNSFIIGSVSQTLNINSAILVPREEFEVLKEQVAVLKDRLDSL